MLREQLISLLKIYSAQDDNGSIELKRLGKDYDGGYIVPVLALNAADVLMGYGIANDISFEEQFSLQYNKPSYGFDCGTDKINSKSELFHLVKECIATDNFLNNKEKSSHNITTFTQQLQNLSLMNKKLFIKMDIEGAEYNAFKDIYQYHDNITGIVLEVHFNHRNPDSLEEVISLIYRLNKNFVLVHVHANSCVKAKEATFITSNAFGRIPAVIELSYVNKNLVKNYTIAEDQSHPTKLDMPNSPDMEEHVFEILR